MPWEFDNNILVCLFPLELPTVLLTGTHSIQWARSTPHRRLGHIVNMH